MPAVYLRGVYRKQAREREREEIETKKKESRERVCFHICCDKPDGLGSSGISEKHAASQHCRSEEQERGGH